MGIELVVIGYLVTINVVGGIVFCADKLLSIKGGKRVPERTLHACEMMGGSFLMMPLMYVIRHKCSKPAYYVVSWLLWLLWMFVLVMCLKWCKINVLGTWLHFVD